MTRLVALTLALTTAFAVGAPLVRRAGERVTAEDVVAALEGAYGVHPGERRNHTKGTCALGAFVGMSGAGKYSRSALFSGTPVPVVARFSLAGGDPEASDARGARGACVGVQTAEWQPPAHDMINTPMFFAAMPRTFLDKMRAVNRTRRRASRTGSARGVRGESSGQPGTGAVPRRPQPAASYANSAYYGIHTFKFVDRSDKVTLVRWRFVPEDGEKPLTDSALKSMRGTFSKGR